MLQDTVEVELGVGLVKEESPGGEHQANGEIEAVIKQVQERFRTIRDAVESRIGEWLKGNEPILPWMMRHAATVMNRRNIGADGFTPYRRWKGKGFKGAVTELGENIWYFQSASVGNAKSWS